MKLLPFLLALFPFPMLLLPISIPKFYSVACAQITKRSDHPIDKTLPLIAQSDAIPPKNAAESTDPNVLTDPNVRRVESKTVHPSAKTSSVQSEPVVERPSIDELIPLDHPSSGETTVMTDAQGNVMIPFFGHSVRGNHVVFVIDRSMSTGGRGNLTLPLIRAQIRKALAGLGDVQRFELIVYSDTPRLYNPTGNRGKIAFANDENKERAIAFLDKVRPHGNTDHLPAVRLALDLRPDLLFWLTDGDEPRLSREELDQIRDWSIGTRIYTIEFGVGNEPRSPGFLKTVALENGGKYQWIDLVQALKEWQKRLPQEK